MYDEKDYGFNWIGLFIKIIIAVLVILLLIWIISKLFLSYTDKDLKNDMSAMNTAAQKYFTTSKVPTEVGDSAIITLDELLNKKLITSSSIKSCDKDESLAKVTKFEEYYMLKIELQCGKKSDSKTSKFTPSDGTSSTNSSTNKTTNKNKTNTTTNETNKTVENETKKDSGSNSSSGSSSSSGSNSKSGSSSSSSSGGSSSSSSESSNTKKTLYYEYAKIKYKTVTNQYATYCTAKSSGKEYYSVSYIGSGSYAQGFSYSYQVNVQNMPSNFRNVKVTNTRILSSSTDFSNYVATKSNLCMVGTSCTSSTGYSASVYKEHSLKGGFTPTVTYSGNNTVTISIKVNTKMTVSAYNGMVFVPVGFTLLYEVPSSKCVSDLASNSSKYSNYFKTKTYSSVSTVEDGVDYNDTKWSTSSSLSGYKKTGNTEYR